MALISARTVLARRGGGWERVHIAGRGQCSWGYRPIRKLLLLLLRVRYFEYDKFVFILSYDEIDIVLATVVIV